VCVTKTSLIAIVVYFMNGDMRDFLLRIKIAKSGHNNENQLIAIVVYFMNGDMHDFLSFIKIAKSDYLVFRHSKNKNVLHQLEDRSGTWECHIRYQRSTRPMSVLRRSIYCHFNKNYVLTEESLKQNCVNAD
jgi:hypothetical protein